MKSLQNDHLISVTTIIIHHLLLRIIPVILLIALMAWPHLWKVSLSSSFSSSASSSSASSSLSSLSQTSLTLYCTKSGLHLSKVSSPSASWQICSWFQHHHCDHLCQRRRAKKRLKFSVLDDDDDDDSDDNDHMYCDHHQRGCGTAVPHLKKSFFGTFLAIKLLIISYWCY